MCLFVDSNFLGEVENACVRVCFPLSPNTYNCCIVTSQSGVRPSNLVAHSAVAVMPVSEQVTQRWLVV